MPGLQRREILAAATAAVGLGLTTPSPGRAFARDAGVGAEFVALFDPTTKPEAREAFWAQRLSSAGRNRWPLAQLQARIARLADLSGGLELLAINETDGQLRLQVRARRQNVVRGVRLRPDRDDPTRLFDISLAPMPSLYDRPGPAPASREALAFEIERRIRFSADRDEFSGAVAVTAPDGETVCRMAVGSARRDTRQPMRIDTRLNLGSADKSFTAIMIGRLVDEGRLSFETPLIEALPDYPDPTFARSCTIQHLMTHCSGLGGLFDRPTWDWKRPFASMADLFPVFALADRAFEPGTGAAYSNEGYVVLGGVLEAVAGASWYDLLSAQIYSPAGMIDSGHFTDVGRVERLAFGYAYSADDDLGLVGRLPNDGHRGYRGNSCGGGYSTVDDMTAYLRVLRAGELVSPGTTSALIAQQPHGLADYGRGFTRRSVGSRTLVGHGGGGPHSGIDGDHFVVWETGWTVSILGNFDLPFTVEIARDLARWVATQPG